MSPDPKPCDCGEDVLAVLERTYLLDRHAATADSWKALEILGEYLDLEIHSFPSGTECFTWRVPPGWAVDRAEIRLGDRVLLRHADHPLTVQPYSDSFSGRVGRDELLKHLVWSEARPDAYAYRAQLAYQTDLRRDWQMSLPWAVVRDLPEGDYEIDLRTRFFDGAMPVGEAVLEGDSPHSILIVAHICHPGIADDGLSGAVTGIRLMRWLSALPRRRYTYRLLLPVETIGSIAWLWKRSDLLPHLAAGMVLESLGNAAPFAWKRSYPGDTPIDRIARHVARRFGDIEERDFRDKVGNDELVFGDPDFAVPMVGLQRWPYPDTTPATTLPPRCPPRAWTKASPSPGGSSRFWRPTRCRSAASSDLCT